MGAVKAVSVLWKKNHILHNETDHEDMPFCTWTVRVFCANCFGSASNHGFDWTQEEEAL